jgi:predicted DNA-binding transcriptional regulator AlpA
MAITGELLGTGDVAEHTGYSRSGIKKLESLGVIPRALRVAGTGRRAWRSEDLPLIKERIAARRRQHEGPEAA